MRGLSIGATIIAVLTATPVLAADTRGGGMADRVYVGSWQGPYAGVHAGGSWGDATASFAGVSGTDDYDGMQGGVQAGWNWQGSAWVFGIEGDFSFTGNDSSTSALGLTVSSELQWMATVRARVGRDLGRWMPYATLGVAFGENEATFTSGPVTQSQSRIHTGLAAGLGAEFMLSDALSLKGEYLYVDFGDENYTAGPLPPGGVNAEAELHVLRVGLNYHW